MGGVLPAAVARRGETETQVICLHDEFYTNYLLTVQTSEITPFTYPLTQRMKAIIDDRLQTITKADDIVLPDDWLSEWKAFVNEQEAERDAREAECDDNWRALSLQKRWPIGTRINESDFDPDSSWVHTCVLIREITLAEWFSKMSTPPKYPNLYAVWLI